MLSSLLVPRAAPPPVPQDLFTCAPPQLDTQCAHPADPQASPLPRPTDHLFLGRLLLGSLLLSRCMLGMHSLHVRSSRPSACSAKQQPVVSRSVLGPVLQMQSEVPAACLAEQHCRAVDQRAAGAGPAVVSHHDNICLHLRVCICCSLCCCRRLSCSPLLLQRLRLQLLLRRRRWSLLLLLRLLGRLLRLLLWLQRWRRRLLGLLRRQKLLLQQLLAAVRRQVGGF